MTNSRFYQIAGMTIQVSSDLPIRSDTFHPKLNTFAIDEPGSDLVKINHHFELPDLNGKDLGQEIYRHPPWAIHAHPRKGYTYIWTPPAHSVNGRHRTAFFSADHTVGEIYNDPTRREAFLAGNLESLTFFPTDQILIARLLGDRQGCILHSCGAILDGKGFVFVGHSDAGKTTMATMLKTRGTILCDDRNIVRRRGETFQLHGTWSHGDLVDISADSAPLAAVMFLVQSQENRLIPLYSKGEAIRRLLACLIKPFVTKGWWERMLENIEAVVKSTPCFELHFDRSGSVAELLQKL